MRVIELSSRLQLSFVGNVLPDALTTGDIDGDGGFEFLIGNSDGDMAIYKGRGGKGSWFGSETHKHFEESYWSDVETQLFDDQTGFEYNLKCKTRLKQKKKITKPHWEDVVKLEKSSRQPWAIAKNLGTITSIVVGDVFNNGKQIVLVINCEGKLHLFEYPFGIPELKTYIAQKSLQVNNDTLDSPVLSRYLYNQFSENIKSEKVENIKVTKKSCESLNRKRGSKNSLKDLKKLSKKFSTSKKSELKKLHQTQINFKHSDNYCNSFKNTLGSLKFRYKSAQDLKKVPNLKNKNKFKNGNSSFLPQTPIYSKIKQLDNTTEYLKNIKKLSLWQPYKISSPKITFDIPTNAARAIIADVNDDGLNEIIISTTDGFVYSFGLTVDASTENNIKFEHFKGQSRNASDFFFKPQFTAFNTFKYNKPPNINIDSKFTHNTNSLVKSEDFKNLSISNNNSPSEIFGKNAKIHTNRHYDSKYNNYKDKNQIANIDGKSQHIVNSIKKHNRKAFSVSSIYEITGKINYSNKSSPITNKLVVYNDKTSIPPKKVFEVDNLVNKQDELDVFLNIDSKSYSSHKNTKRTEDYILNSLNSLILHEEKNYPNKFKSNFLANKSVSSETNSHDKPHTNGLFSFLNNSNILKWSSTAPASLANSRNNSNSHSRVNSVSGVSDLLHNKKKNLNNNIDFSDLNKNYSPLELLKKLQHNPSTIACDLKKSDIIKNYSCEPTETTKYNNINNNNYSNNSQMLGSSAKHLPELELQKLTNNFNLKLGNNRESSFLKQSVKVPFKNYPIQNINECRSSSICSIENNPYDNINNIRKPHIENHIHYKSKINKPKKLKTKMTLKALNTWFMDNFLGSLVVIQVGPGIFKERTSQSNNKIKQQSIFDKTKKTSSSIFFNNYKKHFLVISKPGGKLAPINPQGSVLETIHYLEKNNDYRSENIIANSLNFQNLDSNQKPINDIQYSLLNDEKKYSRNQFSKQDNLLSKEHSDYFEGLSNFNSAKLNAQPYIEKSISSLSQKNKQEVNSFNIRTKDLDNQTKEYNTDVLGYNEINKYLVADINPDFFKNFSLSTGSNNQTESLATSASRNDYDYPAYKTTNLAIDSHSLPKDRFIPRLMPAQTTVSLESVVATTKIKPGSNKLSLSYFPSDMNLSNFKTTFNCDSMLSQSLNENFQGFNYIEKNNECPGVAELKNSKNSIAIPLKKNILNLDNKKIFDQAKTINVVSSLKALLNAEITSKDKKSVLSKNFEPLYGLNNKISNSNFKSETSLTHKHLFNHSNSTINSSRHLSILNTCDEIQYNFKKNHKDNKTLSKNTDRSINLSASVPLSLTRTSMINHEYINSKVEDNKILTLPLAERYLDLKKGQNLDSSIFNFKDDDLNYNKNKSALLRSIEKESSKIRDTFSDNDSHTKFKINKYNVKRNILGSAATEDQDINDSSYSSDDLEHFKLGEFTNNDDVSTFIVGDVNGGFDVSSLGLVSSPLHQSRNVIVDSSKINLIKTNAIDVNSLLTKNSTLIKGSSWIFSLTIDGMLFGFNYENKSSFIVDINARDPLLGVWKISAPDIYSKSTSSSLLDFSIKSLLPTENGAKNSNLNYCKNLDLSDYLVTCTWRGTTYFVSVSSLLALVSEYSSAQSQNNSIGLKANTLSKNGTHSEINQSLQNSDQAYLGDTEIHTANTNVSSYTEDCTKITNSSVIQFKFLEIVNAFLAAPYAPVVGKPNVFCLFYVDFKTRVWIYYHLDTITELDYNYEKTIKGANSFEIKKNVVNKHENKISKRWNNVHEFLKRNSRTPWVSSITNLEKNFEFTRRFLHNQRNSLEPDSNIESTNINSANGSLGLQSKNGLNTQFEYNNDYDVLIKRSNNSYKNMGQADIILNNKTLKSINTFSKIISTKPGILLQTQTIIGYEVNTNTEFLKEDQELYDDTDFKELWNEPNYKPLYIFDSGYYFGADSKNTYDFKMVENYTEFKDSNYGDSFKNNKNQTPNLQSNYNTLISYPSGIENSDNIKNKYDQQSEFKFRKPSNTNNEQIEEVADLNLNLDVGLVNLIEFIGSDLLDGNLKESWCDKLDINPNFITDNTEMASISGLSELISKILYESL
ncbi:hypothetical protein BB561_002334 [Smittium simulii]|uniref:Uncharacterized protein n=1 Tax=Smittium simulii TaxID=133385 RepID=A0A2T9YQS3_9FUNG|nr:hypothetical protein BB561_002334 [Smittium simulii]